MGLKKKDEKPRTGTQKPERKFNLSSISDTFRNETFLFVSGSFLAVIAVFYIETKGIGALSFGVPGKYALMFLSGLITLIPIALFGSAAKKVTLFVIGLAQYISPTITLLLGIFAYKEPIDRVQVISFAIIWIGLVFFSYGEYKNNLELES